jgi:hypothetical protein
LPPPRRACVGRRIAQRRLLLFERRGVEVVSGQRNANALGCQTPRQTDRDGCAIAIQNEDRVNIKLGSASWSAMREWVRESVFERDRDSRQTGNIKKYLKAGKISAGQKIWGWLKKSEEEARPYDACARRARPRESSRRSSTVWRAGVRATRAAAAWRAARWGCRWPQRQRQRKRKRLHVGRRRREQTWARRAATRAATRAASPGARTDANQSTLVSALMSQSVCLSPR